MHTELWAELEEQGMICPFFFVGDSVYQGFTALAYPHIGALDETQAAYNFLLSQLCITIEQAFGMLVKRWAVLWKQLHMQIAKGTEIVEACMRLHNHCIMCNDKDPVMDVVVVDAEVDKDPSAVQDDDMPVLNNAGTPQARLWYAPDSLQTQCHC